MSKRCKYGKLKSPSKGRRCRKAPRRGARKSSKRRSRSSSRRGLKIAGIGAGTLGLLAVAGTGLYLFTKPDAVSAP